MANELNALEEAQGESPAVNPEDVVTGTEETAPATVDDAPDATSLQAEIDDLKTQKEKAKERAIYWRQQKAEARKEYFKDNTPPAAQPAPAAETQLKKPDPDDFDDYNKYVDALTDYKADVKIEQWNREQARKSQSESARQREAKLQEGINAGYAKYNDFEDVAMDPSVPITPMVTDILAETENPADIAYYLGKNRPEAVKISRMTPLAAAREIAKIEVKLTSGGTPAPTKNPTKKTTNAPPPINPVGSNAPATAKNPEDMTQSEYEEWREKQGARRF